VFILFAIKIVAMAGQFADNGFNQRVIGNKVLKQGYDPSLDNSDPLKQTWKRGGGEESPETVFVLLQPDLTLDLSPSTCPTHTYIQMFKRVEELVEVIQQLSAEELQKLMVLKKLKLAESHKDRFKSFSKLNTKQACLMFGGKTLMADQFSDKERKFAEKHLRFISGLYGVLRPYDDIRPVRDVPMGSKLTTKRGKTVAEFWGDSISKQLAKDAKDAATGNGKVLVVSLLSEEYHATITAEALGTSCKLCQIYLEGGGEDDTRRVRSRMARHLLRDNICTPEAVREYDDDDWELDTTRSYNHRLVFKFRGEAASKKDKKKKKKRDSSDASEASGKAKDKKKADRSRSPDSADRGKGKKTRAQETQEREEKKIEQVRDAAYDSDDSGAFVIAPKKRDDAGIRESSRSVKRKRAGRREADADDERRTKRRAEEIRRSRSRRGGEKKSSRR